MAPIRASGGYLCPLGELEVRLVNSSKMFAYIGQRQGEPSSLATTNRLGRRRGRAEVRVGLDSRRSSLVDAEAIVTVAERAYSVALGGEILLFC